MTDADLIERAAQAIYDAPNGVDGDAIGTILFDWVEAVSSSEARDKAMDICRLAARAGLDAITGKVD
jgi:hypothetical protein